MKCQSLFSGEKKKIRKKKSKCCLLLARVFGKVFKRLYLLKLWIEVVHTCPDIRYWSESLCCTKIPFHMSDLDVNFTDLRKNYI